MTATQTLNLGAELAGRVRARVNTQAVYHDIQRPFRFLICGDPSLVLQVRATLLQPYLDALPADEAGRLLETLRPGSPTVHGSDIRCILDVRYPGDGPPPIEMLAPFKVPILSLVVDPDLPPSVQSTPPMRGHVETFRVPSLSAFDLNQRVFAAIVECCKGVEVAVGLRLPILREAVCAALIREAARNALKIAVASAAVEQVPLLGFVIGAVAAAGDTVAISVVQLNLVLRIGAVFGRSPQVHTAWELVPIVGGGLGWRALSRELAGFIPVAGVAIKGAIAYAGTVVVGEGASLYHRTGRHMSAQDARALYRDTKRAAIELAREIAGRLRGRG